MRVHGLATLAASMHQGGDQAGTIRLTRRERVATRDGSVLVPVVSGNGWRGVLRDVSAWMAWELAGKPELTMAAQHALWSGGSLAKTADPLTSVRLRELRALLPHVAVLGTAAGGRIVEGRVKVGKIVPVCAQTRHIAPAHVAEQVSVWPDMHDLLQVEEFSRKDDQPLAVAEGDESTVQMRYGMETIAAGTQVWWWWSLDPHTTTELDRAWWTLVLDRWDQSGAHLGGRSSSGHGRLVPVDGWHTGDVTAARALVEAHHAERDDEVHEALSWLT